MGSSIVVTPIGARGLDDSANAYVKVDMKADPKQAARMILELLGNSGWREKLGRAATAYIRRCFSREAFFEAMDRVMAAVELARDAAGPTPVKLVTEASTSSFSSLKGQQLRIHSPHATSSASPNSGLRGREVA